MQLIRLGTIELTRPAPLQLSRWALTASNGVTVEVSHIVGAEEVRDVTRKDSGLHRGVTAVWPYDTATARLGVQATVEIGRVEPSSNGLLTIPAEPRVLAEAAIVEFADVLAITYQCRRVVRSPSPCVAVGAADPEDQSILDASVGIDAPMRTRPRAVLLPGLTNRSPLVSLLADRLDGLGLLADALSEDGPVGQVHNLFRVFERAFASGPSGCIDPLLELLRSGPIDLHWTREEISDWFQRLRAEVTHADRREVFARSAEVEPFVGRLEYAAFDVLLNKATWRIRDGERREGIRLAAGVDSDSETMCVDRSGATVIMPWIDPFGVFPIDFGYTVTVAQPAVSAMPGYTPDEDSIYSTRVRVRDLNDPEQDILTIVVQTVLGDLPTASDADGNDG